jgi:outer membrane protein assembly factor BamD (BamD/ComL family)
MHLCRTLRSPLFLVVAAALTAGCAALDIPAPFDTKAPAGTAAWWRGNKKKAVFVPHAGYQVAGTGGFYDAEGRPINSRVAKVVEQDDGGGLLGDVKFKGAVNELKQTVGLGPNQQAAKTAFDEGEQLFRAENYGEAAKKFKEAYKGWPDSQLEQDALFQLGESYFFAENYAKANDAYEKLIRKYPSSHHLDNIITRQFSIARYWEQYQDYNPNWVTTPNLIDNKRPLFDTLGRAIKVYENIRMNDPTGPLADDAIMATANSYFRRGRYEDADYQYDLLRKEYPRSEHQYNAHVLGLQCKLRKYQGADYDGMPLEEAKQLVKQQKIQFAGQLDADQRQRLAETDAALNKELATREYQMAEHFENIEEYGAAKFYHAQVIRNHPQSPLAAQSRERITALAGLPDRPTSALEPLLELVPESAERRAVADVPLLENPAPTGVPVPDDGRIMQAQGQGDATSASTVTR